MACVYCHVRLDTDEVFYVGIGRSEKRAFDMKRGRNKYHKSITSNHGARVQVIIKDIEWDVACFWEKAWIKALKGAGYKLANMTDGGDGVFNPSDEVRIKISKALTGNKHASGIIRTEHQRIEISKRMTGNQVWLGRSHSEETINKIKDKLSGRPGRKKSQEEKDKISKTMTGKKRPKETCNKMSASMTKRWAKNPFYGRKVICLDDGNIFVSCAAAGRFYNINSSALSELCNGKRGRKTVGGFRFAYYEEA